MAFMMLRSLRMQATITTFAGFPAALQVVGESAEDGIAPDSRNGRHV